MNISIIIPTTGKERAEDLIKALRSIEANTIKPLEVLIIDQGNLEPRMLGGFNLDLTLVRVNKKSLTQAENIGAGLARGDIVSILDDDVVLDKNYYQEILASFDKYKEVKIVQGKITNFKTHKIREFFWGLFLGPGSLKKNCVVRSVNLDPIFYKSYLNAEDFCMWASGCNMNIDREVLASEKFDPQELRCSFDEDIDFSYRIYKRFGPRSILFQPKAKLIHNVSSQGRLPKSDQLLMSVVTRIYLNYKHKNISKNGNIGRSLLRLWRDFGFLLFYVLKIFRGDYKSWFHFLVAQYQVWRHRQEIRSLDIEWMNLKLFNEKSTPEVKILEKIKI